METSCVESLMRLIRARNILITMDGKIFKILSHNDYKLQSLKLCGLIMVGFLAYIIKRFPYHPITIMGNTVYSRVAASTLSLCKVPYILCKSTNRISYYETDDGKEIAFEGPSPNFFLQSAYKDQLIPLIPCSQQELIKLEQHTKLKDLTNIQSAILSNFKNKEGVYVANIGDIIDNGTSAHNPIIHIKKFWGNMYYIMTATEIWLSNIVITDTVVPLQSGEIISGLYGTSTNGTYNEYQVITKGSMPSRFALLTNPSDIKNLAISNPEPPQNIGSLENLAQNKISNSFINPDTMSGYSSGETASLSVKGTSLYDEELKVSLCEALLHKSSNSDNICIIIEPKVATILQRRNSYAVDIDFSIKTTQNISENKRLETHSCEAILKQEHFNKESILYNLCKARTFNHDGIYILHPFHLPSTWDPFLTIMIITQALICQEPLGSRPTGYIFTNI